MSVEWPLPGAATSALLRAVVDGLDRAQAQRTLTRYAPTMSEEDRERYRTALTEIKKAIATLERERDEARAVAAELAYAYMYDVASPSVETVALGMRWHEKGRR